MKVVRVHERFLLYSFLILLAMMAGLAIFNSYQFKDILLTETYDRAREFENNLRGTFTSLLVTYNYSTIYTNVNNISAQQNIIYIAIYDKELKLAASNSFYRENSETILGISGVHLPEVKDSLFRSGELRLPAGKKIHVLDILSPVYMKPSSLRWGIIHVGLSLENIYDHLTRIQLLMLLSFVITLVAIYFMLRWMGRMIQKPMDALLKGADEIGSGNFKFSYQLNVSNEFGVLADSFNKMVSRVNQLQERQENWNRELESRIEERTRALQQTRQFLENVFNSLTECVITINHEGFLTSANRQFYRLSGFSMDAIGKPFARIFFNRGLFKFKALRYFIRALHGETLHFEQTMTFTGKELLLDIEVSPLAGIDGSPHGVLVIARDISQQRELEQQLLQAQKMESIGTLAGGIAHDFNNILAAIVPAVELLKKKLQGQDLALRKIEIVEQSAKRAVELTSQLLTFSRKQEIQVQVLNLNEIVQSALTLADASLPAHMSIKEQLDPLLDRCKGNRVLLEQMILNLIKNAITAVADGGTISVCTRNYFATEEFIKNHPEVPLGSYAELVIKDTGTGIDEKYINRIFDPFFSTRGVGKGTGMGLAVVYSAVKRHQGYIFCVSEPGKGTEFRILLPSFLETIVSEEMDDSSLPGGSEHIIVVDDEEMVREVAKDLLKELGYQVEMASGGREALAKIQHGAEPFHLVLLDMIMPDLDGLETLTALRAIQPGLKVVLISGYDTDEKIQRALAMKRVEFLQKPYNIVDLAGLVRRFLDEA